MIFNLGLWWKFFAFVIKIAFLIGNDKGYLYQFRHRSKNNNKRIVIVENILKNSHSYFGNYNKSAIQSLWQRIQIWTLNQAKFLKFLNFLKFFTQLKITRIISLTAILIASTNIRSLPFEMIFLLLGKCDWVER